MPARRARDLQQALSIVQSDAVIDLLWEICAAATETVAQPPGAEVEIAARDVLAAANEAVLSEIGVTDAAAGQAAIARLGFAVAAWADADDNQRRPAAANGHMRLLRKKDVLKQVGISAMTLWRLETAGQFPKRVQIGTNSVGYVGAEIDAWIAAKAETRRG
ncbi:putative DNA-binding transcriptional regulator AlpA [Skermanella aerolata]|uniref:helix-turn-helix transcriptional regulator n=1 Tax=Skermanella aerolata TaxID=393310 RepID=UPI003D19543E